MGVLLEVKNLRTYFYTLDTVVKAVDGVSFNVEEGEIVGLVGESGCGKTVSALSLLRLIPIPPGKIVTGEVIFEGKDLINVSQNEIRNIRGNKNCHDLSRAYDPRLILYSLSRSSYQNHCKCTKR